MAIGRIQRRVASMGRLGLVYLATGFLAPQSQAQEVTSELIESATKADVLFGSKRVAAGSVEAKLTAPLRRTLNSWACFAAQHNLQIAIPNKAEVMLLVRLDDKQELSQLLKHLDAGWKRLSSLRPKSLQGSEAVLAVILDSDGFDQVWPALLADFVDRRLLSESSARSLESDRTALMLRSAGIFVQPSWDVVGNVAAGDDEFRLDHEVVHKTTQCALTTWYGQVPEQMRWGLGYVLEQHVFQSIYQFDRSGFISTTDHFGWPKKAYERLKDRGRSERFSLAGFALDARFAGTLSDSQLITWAVIDYLVVKDPARLQDLLAELAELHAEATGRKQSPDYLGDRNLSRETLERQLESISVKTLMRHIKRVK